MTIDEALRLREIEDPQLSPDGSRVVYLVAELDEDSKEYRRHLWLVPVSGDEPARQLTFDAANPAEPRWSPDGTHLAFTAKRDGDEARQAWLLPVAGGEARRLTRAEGDVHGLDWSPDGHKLLFLSQEPKDKEEKDLEERGGIRVVDRFVRMHQVWTVEVASGHCRCLTRDRSSKAAARWSPDGRRIAFEQRRDPTTNHTYRASLWLVGADGRNRCRLTEGACDTGPRWSPDGRRIAFRRRDTAGYAHLENLAVVDVRGGEVRVLTGHLDRAVVLHEWLPGGRRLVALVHHGARQHLHAVTARGGRVTPLTGGDRQIFAVRVAGRSLVFLSETPRQPAEVHVAGLDGGGERTLTDTNPELGRAGLARTRLVRWRAPDGLQIEGVLVLPRGYRKGRRLPLLVEPHGGPAGARGLAFYGAWQVMAARGYAVLAPNFRGSAGYGQDFLAANADDFGGGDFADLMAGVDAMVDRGIADGKRLGILGYSYGGFMTAWAIGHTRRFRAAVAGAGVTNLTSFYGTTDIQWFTTWYQQARPWERPAAYAAQSPISHVGRVKTPTLICHGDEDRRVPMEQSEQLYVSLRERGVPVEFVRYPRAAHGLTEYWHRRDYLERAVAWFDHWVRGRK